jgi:general nucleoside transport system permease protein
MSAASFNRTLPALVVVAITAAVSAILVLVAGASPLSAFESLARGSIGSRAAIGETLVRSTPLILTALGAVVAFRAGVLNIGIEGQFLVGAAAAAAVGPPLGSAPLVARIALLGAAALAGALFVLPAAWLSEKRNVPVVLSTILLNLVAAALISWLVRGPLKDLAGDYPQTAPLSESVRLGPLFSGSRATSAPLLAVALAVVVAFVLKRTRAGLVLKAVGFSPKAARAAGLPEVGIRVAAFAASGALAGLAGGLEVCAVTGRLYDPFGAGIGYAGIAAALLGALRPAGAVASSLLFAALGAGSSALQRDSGIPSSLATIVPAIAVLGVLATRAQRWRSAR